MKKILAQGIGEIATTWEGQTRSLGDESLVRQADLCSAAEDLPDHLQAMVTCCPSHI